MFHEFIQDFVDDVSVVVLPSYFESVLVLTLATAVYYLHLHIHVAAAVAADDELAEGDEMDGQLQFVLECRVYPVVVIQDPVVVVQLGYTCA